MPRTPLEACIVSIFKVLLQTESIGVHSDFFLAGGNSLLAGAFMSKLREQSDAGLPTWLIFAHR